MAKKITVTLSDKAEKYFNELMYSLPSNKDGASACTQSEAINESLETLSDFETLTDDQLRNWNDNFKNESKTTPTPSSSDVSIQEEQDAIKWLEKHYPYFVKSPTFVGIFTQYADLFKPQHNGEMVSVDKIIEWLRSSDVFVTDIDGKILHDAIIDCRRGFVETQIKKTTERMYTAEEMIGAFNAGRKEWATIQASTKYSNAEEYLQSLNDKK